MSTDALIEFARDLAAEVEDATGSGDGSVYSEEEFTRIILDRLGDDGALDNPIALYQEGTFGRSRYKITGYSVSDDDDRLLLVTTIHSGEVPPRDLAKDQIRGAVMQAANFYQCSCVGLHSKIEPANTDASDLARKIYEIHDQIEVLRVVLITDGMTGLKSLDAGHTKDGTRILVDLYGIERLHRILGGGLTRDDIVLDFIAEEGQSLPALLATHTEDYDAYLAAIPGTALADLYEKYGTRLLELNVRGFLGVRGRKSVNAGLRQTILDLPTRFLAYNNGIVATADEVELEPGTDDQIGIRALRGIQIVNGGQTTASLHRARKQDKADLSAIAVPAKIIKVGVENLDSLVSAISRSANSQNTIQPADLSANDPFHVAVEGLANNTWLPDQSGRWFYERARGSYGASEYRASFKAAAKRRFASETPKARRFTKTDLAKYLNAWDGLPHLVSMGNQKNFQLFMQSLKERYSEGFEPDAAWFRAFVAKAIFFRAVQAIVKEKKFPAYQANIIAYTVALIAAESRDHFDFERVWYRQGISDQLVKMVGDRAVEVDRALRRTAGSRMPSEWAKKEDCWSELKDVQYSAPRIIPDELAEEGGTSTRIVRRGAAAAKASA